MDCRFSINFFYVIISYIAQQALSAIPEYFVEEHCSQTLALNHGSVEAVKLRLTKTLKYPDGMRCAMRIQAPTGKRLIIRIENIDVFGSQERLCQGGDYLQFFDGPSESSIIHPELPTTVCQRPDVSHISTSGRFLVLRFVSNADKISGTGMRLIITAFSEAPCSKDDFRCKSTFHCIQSSLHCDQQPSCPDGTDERMPDCLSTAVIVGISVACVVLLVAVIIVIAVCYAVRKRRKRARIIKRAMEHQVQHQTYADSLWIVNSQHSGVHSSKLDPIWDANLDPSSIGRIWDGGIDPSKIDPIWDGGKVYWDSVNAKTDTNHEYDTCKDGSRIVDSDESTKEIKVIRHEERQMKKVPSGFWDIDLSDLGIDLSLGSTPATIISA